MILSNGQIRPGQVLQVLDEFGLVKASVPGFFAKDSDPELIPPMYPFFSMNSNSFSKVNVGDDIWVLFFNDNPQEFLYFRNDNLRDELSTILKKEYKEVEVVCSRESGLGYAQLFFTDGTGWVINNQDSSIEIQKDGTILLNGGQSHRVIEISDDGISIGSKGGSAEPALLGDRTEDLLQSIANALSALEQVAKSNPYTVQLAVGIKSYNEEIASKIKKIKSSHVTLD